MLTDHLLRKENLKSLLISFNHSYAREEDKIANIGFLLDRLLHLLSVPANSPNVSIHGLANHLIES